MSRLLSANCSFKALPFLYSLRDNTEPADLLLETVTVVNCHSTHMTSGKEGGCGGRQNQLETRPNTPELCDLGQLTNSL